MKNRESNRLDPGDPAHLRCNLRAPAAARFLVARLIRPLRRWAQHPSTSKLALFQQLDRPLSLAMSQDFV